MHIIYSEKLSLLDTQTHTPKKDKKLKKKNFLKLHLTCFTSGITTIKGKDIIIQECKAFISKQHYPIWYAVHLSKPVAVTHVSPQKKLRPPTTIATWDITKNKYIRCQNPNHQQTSRVAKNNHAKINTSTPRRQAIATSLAINITTCQKK